MSTRNLGTVFEPGAASRMGGAANGGSAKTPQERERLDEERQGGDLDSPTAGDTRSTPPSEGPEADRSDRPASPDRDR